jgi:NADH-quinone oxidoreductase subunit M
MVGYATVAEVGFCLVGLGAMTREGIAGCLIQASSQGLVTAVLLLTLGVLYEREKTCDVERLGGLGGAMPFFTAIAGLAMLASAGAPGLPGFWGELISVLGVFPGQRLLGGCAAAGAVVVATAYMRAARRLFFEPSRGEAPASLELSPREIASVAPLVLIVLALGLAPGSFFTLVQGGVADLNQLVNPPGPDEIA